MKYEWPFISLARPFKIKEIGETDEFCTPRSANIEGAHLYIYGADNTSDYGSARLSLADARKLGRFINDTIGLKPPVRKGEV